MDGEAAAIVPANLHRLGIEVPAGTHRVRVWPERRPTQPAWAVAALGVLGLVALAGIPAASATVMKVPRS